MALDEVATAKELQKNEGDHQRFLEYFANDRRALEKMTENVNKMSQSITELVLTQQHQMEQQKQLLEQQKELANKKSFWDTWAGRVMLIFGLLVIAGLLVAAIGVNIWNIAPSEVAKVLGG